MADVKITRLIDEVFKGSRGLRETLERAGFKPPADDTVRKWRERDSMPAGWLAATILAGTGDFGPRFDIGDYVSGRTQGWDLRRKSELSGSSHGIFD